MCSVAHIFERVGLIRARCVCGPRRRKETRQFVTATSALEMELMTPGASASVTPQKTQSSLRLQGQGSSRRTRTGRLTSHNRAITNPKLRDILFVECVEKREGPSGRRTLYEIGTKEARWRRRRGSIHPRLVPQTAKSDGSRSEPKVQRRKSEFTISV